MKKVPLPGGPKRLLDRVLKALDNSDDVERVITQSLLDPAFAATLLKRPTPRHWLQVQHGMLGRKVSNSIAQLGRPLIANDNAGTALPSLQAPVAAGQGFDDQNQPRRVER